MTAQEFSIQGNFQADRSTPLRWVLSHVGRHKHLFVIMFIGAFGNGALAAAIPVFTGIAFTGVLADPVDYERLQLAAIGIIVSQVLRSLLQFGRNFASEVIGQRLERDTRQELYLSLLGKSMTFHDSQPVGDTMARATNDVREVNLMLNPGINLVVGSANFMIMPLIFAPQYDPRLIFAPLFYIILYIFALIRYLNVLRPISDDVRGSFGSLNSRLAEAIDGIETVKGAAQEEQEVAMFRQNARAFRNAAVEQGYVEARYLPLLLLGVTNAIGFAHALLLFQQGAVATADVVAYMGLLALFGFPTFISLRAYSQVASGMAGARRILELIKEETDLDANASGYDGEMKGGVTFEKVTFGYVDSVPVLQDISLTIEPGQTVAIVGQTGSGKSTVAKLINRTYDVGTGRVLIDGRDVRQWNLAAVRRQTSIIEQDIFMFSRTVAENIAFGQPQATREEIIDAAKTAQAHEFIMGFKDGYDTIVGERGVTLSG
ncbi:MAG TPA: ABC transporter ATP-binding protein, partial [Anaerolineae bacterium]|nr:ABC transporter ATP-binding protein [Anaerolineae bacterium]